MSLPERDSLAPVALVHDAFWAIEEKAANLLLAQLRATSAALHVVEFEAAGGSQGAFGEDGYAVQQGVAIVSIVGPMTKSPTSLSGGCSTVIARRQVRHAARNGDVKAILLRIDSPGGSVSGTEALAADVAEARRQKPCYAYAEDDCCSAAYWVASQANKVFASPTARIGSIGTYAVVEDWSRLFENAGVRVHVISTGKYKGAGATGSQVSDEHLAEWQRTVDDLNAHFLSAVAAGRRMARSKVEALADGRVWIGEKAVDMGLADEVAGFDSVFASLAGKRGGARAEAAAHSGLPLADECETVLTAVGSLTARIADIAAKCHLQGRPLNKKASAHVAEILRAFDEAGGSLSSALAGEGGAPERGSDEAAAREHLARTFLAS